jgi:hypothetical protein
MSEIKIILLDDWMDVVNIFIATYRKCLVCTKTNFYLRTLEVRNIVVDRQQKML